MESNYNQSFNNHLGLLLADHLEGNNGCYIIEMSSIKDLFVNNP